MSAWLPKSKTGRRWLGLAPSYIVVGIFMLIPILIMAVFSFLEPNPYGGVLAEPSFAAYIKLFMEYDLEDNLVFNPGYLIIIWRSFELSIMATLLCLIVGFPVAYFITLQPEDKRNFYIYLVTIPFWTNLLIRTFAWIIILGRGGVIEAPLKFFGIMEDTSSFNMMYTEFAVAVGLTYSYLPLMVLPIYASLEKLDFRLLEAASDLYSNRWVTMWKVVIPLCKPGIIAGCILVFIPCIGAFIAPNLLGGGKQLMLGTLVQFQFASARNWPFGAAVSMLLLSAVVVSLVFYARAAKKRALMEGDA